MKTDVRVLTVTAIVLLAATACDAGTEADEQLRSTTPDTFSSTTSSIPPETQAPPAPPQAPTTIASAGEGPALPDRNAPLDTTIWLVREFDGIVGVSAQDPGTYVELRHRATAAVSGAFPEPRWVDDDTVEYVAHTDAGTRVLRLGLDGKVVTDVPFLDGELPMASDGAGNMLYRSSHPGQGQSWHLVTAEGTRIDLPSDVDLLARHPESGFLVITGRDLVLLDGQRVHPVPSPPADLVPAGFLPSSAAYGREGWLALAYDRTVVVTQQLEDAQWFEVVEDRVLVDFVEWDATGTALILHDLGEARSDPRAGTWICDLISSDPCSRLWPDPNDLPVGDWLEADSYGELFTGTGRARYLLAGPDGIIAVSESGEAHVIWSEPVALAFSDFEGGLVVQVDPSRITRLRPGMAEAEQLVGESGYRFALHDVVTIDGRSHVIYGREPDLEAGAKGAGFQELHLRDLETGADELITVVEVGEGGMSVSYGFGTFAVTGAAEGLSWFTFYDRSGNLLEPAWNPRTRESNARTEFPLVSGGAMTTLGDASVFVYLEASDYPSTSDQAPMDVVMASIPDGDELGRWPLPREPFLPGRLDTHGTRVLVSRWVITNSELTPATPFEIDLESPGAVTQIPVTGIATIARSR